MRRLYGRALCYLIPLVISFSTAVVLTHQAKNIALSDEDSAETFYSFTHGLERYKEERQEWKTRILSNYLVGRLLHVIEQVYHSTDRTTVMPRTAGVWSFLWFLALSIAFVAACRARALFYVFGTFTATAFAYTEGIGATRVYPWDMPSLFVFGCFVVLVRLRREPWLVGLIPIGTLFKETTLLLVVGFLFWPQASRRRRLGAIVVSLLLALTAKGLVDVVTDNPSPVLTMTLRDGPGVARYITNLQHLVAPMAWTTHPVFVNTGLLVALLVLPHADPRIRMLKTIAVPFILGNFFFGHIIEYRIWFELIPLSLYAMEIHFLGLPARATADGREQPAPG
jgi:hypothetical protein